MSRERKRPEVGMSVTRQSWFVSGVLGFFALLVSAITYVPPGPGLWVPALFSGGAILMAVVAITLGSLPSDHWAHRSQPLRVGLAAPLVASVGLLVLFG